MKLKSNYNAYGMNEKEMEYYHQCMEEIEQPVDYDARFEKKKENTSCEVDSYLNTDPGIKGKSGRLANLFSGNSEGDKTVQAWIVIVLCVVMFFVFSDKGVKAIRELSIDSVVVKGVVTDTEKSREYVRTGRTGRVETYYYVTYEWVGDNDRLNTGVLKTKDVAHPLVGDEIDVTVRADNHNIELSSDEKNKDNLSYYAFMSLIWVVFGAWAYIKHIKKD